MKHLILSLSIVGLLFLTACEPDESRKPEPVVGQLIINFHNMVGKNEVRLDTDTFTNDSSNRYWVEYLQYYISNIQLTGCECGPFTEPENYHLIQLVDDPNLGGLVDKHTIEINDVQAGFYDAIEFSVGVDPVRNSSGEMTGALSPVNDMFWGWQSGYIFYKLEGGFINDEGKSEKFAFHIGGDGAYQQLRLDFPSEIEVEEDGSTTLDIYLDVNRTFSTPNPFDLNSFSGTMSPGEKANQVSENYRTGFSLTKP